MSKYDDIIIEYFNNPQLEQRVKSLIPPKFKLAFYDDNVSWQEIFSDDLYALATLNSKELGFSYYQLPVSMDIATLSAIQRLLDVLEINYYKLDVYLVFKTLEERNEAILKIWLSGWNKRSMFENFMKENNIFDLLCPEHILKRLNAI